MTWLGVAPAVPGFWLEFGLLDEFAELLDGLEFVLPLDPLIEPGLVLSGCVGSASSGGLVAAGGFEAFASKDGSTPAASGRENGPTCRTGGVWFGEIGGGLVVPLPVDRLPGVASSVDGLGKT
jgi:hypothetical protein